MAPFVGSVTKSPISRARPSLRRPSPQNLPSRASRRRPRPARAASETPGRVRPGATCTGPAFEVFASEAAGKTVGTAQTQILAENLPAGAYVISANIALEVTPALSVVT